VLEQTYLVRRLFPYFRNIGKRLVKAPKIYLRDSGLLHHLLNITTLEELDSHPVRGASWETIVLEDVIRREQLEHPHSRLYFWRTSAGAEIDLVIERGNVRFALEVKSARADKPSAIRALEAAAKDIEAQRAFFVDMGKGRDPLRPHMERRGFTEALDWLPALEPA
jgi:predicted AAA+ superfamily ATPase